MKPTKSHEKRCGYWMTVTRIPDASPPPTMAWDALYVIDADNLLDVAIALTSFRRWGRAADVSR